MPKKKKYPLVDRQTGVKNKSIKALAAFIGMKEAKNLFEKFGNLTRIGKLSLEELSAQCNSDESDLFALKSAFELGAAQIYEGASHERKLDTESRVGAFLQNDFGGLTKEQVRMIVIDEKDYYIADFKIADGSVNSAEFHVREIFETVLRLGDARRFILAHNHPQGDAKPSQADLEVTQKLIDGAKLLGLGMRDHVIYGTKYGEGGRPYFSYHSMYFNKDLDFD